MLTELFFGKLGEVASMHIVFVDECNVFIFQARFLLVGFEKPFHLFPIPLPGIWGEISGDVHRVRGVGSVGSGVHCGRGRHGTGTAELGKLWVKYG